MNIGSPRDGYHFQKKVKVKDILPIFVRPSNRLRDASKIEKITKDKALSNRPTGPNKAKRKKNYAWPHLSAMVDLILSNYSSPAISIKMRIKLCWSTKLFFQIEMNLRVNLKM